MEADLSLFFPLVFYLFPYPLEWYTIYTSKNLGTLQFADCCLLIALICSP